MVSAHNLSKLSSSQLLGWGLALQALGGVILAISIGAESHRGFVIVVVVLTAAWVVMGVGLTRLAAKADAAFRIHVESNLDGAPAPEQLPQLGSEKAP